jgi:AbrB family looped-hinge helix DNA binding protein
MEQVTVSSKGQIAIPKHVREALNLMQGSKLRLEIRGREIVLSKSGNWRKLQGSARDMTKSFADFRREERKIEDSGH